MSMERFGCMVVVLVLWGCSPAASTLTPAIGTPSPTALPTLASPTPTPSGAFGVSAFELQEVREKLGYALVPQHVPEDFEPHVVDVSGSFVSVVYQKQAARESPRWLFITYPVDFDPEGYLFEGDERFPKRPSDAMTAVTVHGQTAYFVRGQWSADTIRQGPGVDQDAASWDYDVSVSLVFPFKVSDAKTVDVRLFALLGSSAWITVADLVQIAESIVSV